MRKKNREKWFFLKRSFDKYKISIILLFIRLYKNNSKFFYKKQIVKPDLKLNHLTTTTIK